MLFGLLNLLEARSPPYSALETDTTLSLGLLTMSAPVAFQRRSAKRLDMGAKASDFLVSLTQGRCLHNGLSFVVGQLVLAMLSNLMQRTRGTWLNAVALANAVSLACLARRRAVR